MSMFGTGTGATVTKGAERGTSTKVAAPGTKKKKAAAKPPENALEKVLADFGVSYPDAPEASPALLAFARGLGLNLSASEDARRRGIEQVEARNADAVADLERNAERGKRNITTDLMRRGVLSSGESNSRYARQAEDTAARRGDIARAKVEGIGAVDNAYEAAKGTYRTQLLERVLGHETDLATQKGVLAAQEESYRRQEEAADKAYQQQKASQDAYLQSMEDLYKKYGAT